MKVIFSLVLLIYLIIQPLYGFAESQICDIGTNIILLDDIVSHDGKVLVSIFLDNEDKIVGLQMTLTLPMGVKISDFVLDNRCTQHSFINKSAYHEINNSKYTVLFYSDITNDGLKEIEGNSGKVATLCLEIEPEMIGQKVILCDEIVLSTKDGKVFSLNGFETCIEPKIPTDISYSVKETNKRHVFYSLSGIKINDSANPRVVICDKKKLAR